MKKELLVACSLVGEEQDQRKEAVGGLLNASRLACPFVRFELVFEPGGGEIMLRVRGPKGTRQFVSEAFSLASSP